MGRFHLRIACLALLVGSAAAGPAGAEDRPRTAQGTVHVPTGSEMERMERQSRTTPPLTDSGSPNRMQGNDVRQPVPTNERVDGRSQEGGEGRR